MPSPVTPELLSELLADHAAALELFARQWTVSPEDCVQEAMIKLARQTSRPEQPVAWLYRVVRNQAISMGRSESRRKRREATALQQHTDLLKPPANSAFDTEEVNSALTRLDDQLREVIVARIWGGLSYEEIGNLVRCSTATAFRRYESALRELKSRLETSCVKKS